VAKKQKVPKEDLALQTRLGATVKSYRRQLGITQEELAWRADMHRTYLADIERGARNITLRSISNLARALQLSVEGLLFHARGADAMLTTEELEGAVGEIVLIEDNRHDVELALRAFRHAKFTNPVTVLETGESGLDYLFRRGAYAKMTGRLPQLVLLDLDLPVVSGLEVLQSLRANPKTHDLPIVVLTVMRDESLIRECRRLGATDYIVKPIEFASFARTTSNLDFHWTLLPPRGGR
jgi:CheY-like chemotaxis protein/DNA-binding XRE family transcriptional regulator